MKQMTRRDREELSQLLLLFGQEAMQQKQVPKEVITAIISIRNYLMMEGAQETAHEQE